MQEENPIISVIVPVYKVEKYLEKCADSIINQTYKNLEIILVDDGSPDNCGKICDEYANKDKRIKVIHKKNEGVSVARNCGIENSHGKWISFVDADDYIEENYFEILLSEIQKDSADFIMCGYNRIYNEKNKIEKINCTNKKEDGDSKKLLEKALNVQTSYGFCHMKLINANIIKNNNIKFNPELEVAEDAFFIIELSKYINKFLFIGIPLYNYRFNPNSVVRKYDDNYCNKYLKSMKLIKKYIMNNYAENEKILQEMENFIVYHVLLIAVNYSFNKENKKNAISEMNQFKKLCNETDIINESIKKSNYNNLSITRKITLFTIKNKLYFLTMIIGEFRQIQFKLWRNK